MRLEILQVPGCPNVAVLEARIGQAIVGQPVTADIVHHLVADLEQAVALGMRGSPTLLVEGRDPFAEAGMAASLSCRLYRSECGVEGAPTVAALRSALGLADTGDPSCCGDSSCCTPAAGARHTTVLGSARGNGRPADPVERAVHQAILWGFAEHGCAPEVAELSEVFAGQDVSIRSVLWRLHEADIIRLDRDGGITSAYPFSSTPTRHRVHLAGGPSVHAMCAVDALGLAAMLDTDTELDSTDPVTHAPIKVAVRGQHLTADLPGVVVFVGSRVGQGPSADTCCNYVNFFTDAAGARAWADQHLEIPGEILDLDAAHALGNQIFGNLLHENPRGVVLHGVSIAGLGRRDAAEDAVL
ncbi:organomercurial lyase [Nocardia brasiliensis]